MVRGIVFGPKIKIMLAVSLISIGLSGRAWQSDPLKVPDDTCKGLRTRPQREAQRPAHADVTTGNPRPVQSIAIYSRSRALASAAYESERRRSVSRAQSIAQHDLLCHVAVQIFSHVVPEHFQGLCYFSRSSAAFSLLFQ
jgi:hypothetical protein